MFLVAWCRRAGRSNSIKNLRTSFVLAIVICAETNMAISVRDRVSTHIKNPDIAILQKPQGIRQRSAP
jgi:hypothetical protein